LYYLLKIATTLLLKIFFSKRIVQLQSLFATKGPLLLVANHPNSFLDAIIIGAACKYPVHFLARGDAFAKKRYRFLLEGLNMIPIYRMREGREKLYLNANSFEKVQAVLNAHGIVLIFIEGICMLTHELQPFKKGAARIVIEYKGSKALRILPVCVRYEQLPAVFKKLYIGSGKLFDASVFLKEKDTLQIVRNFNAIMNTQLRALLQEGDRLIAANISKPATITHILSVIIWPIYWPVHKVVYLLTKKTVFFDSVLFGVMLLIIPVWLLLLMLLSVYLTYNF
jgi:1-acyl-sn-glycerol-3-phosphate acyltransferase